MAERSSKPICAQNLPPEILEVIFQYLNSRDLGSCSQTCQKWQQIIENQFENKSRILIFTGLPYNKGQRSEVLDLTNPKLEFENWPEISSRYGSVGGTFKDKLIIAGGFDYPNYLQNCRCLDKSGNVSNSIDLTEKRSSAASVKISDTKIWIVGGTSDIFDPSKASNSSEFIDYAKYSVSKGPNLPFTIHSHCMIKFSETEIYIIGGRQNGKIANKTWIVDPKNDFHITEGPMLKYGRARHCGAKIILNGKTILVVAGGESSEDSKELDSVEILDPLSLQGWQNGPKLPYEVVDASMISSPNQNSVILIGGIGKLSLHFGVAQYIGGGNTYSPNIYKSILELTGDDYSSLQWIRLEQRLKYARYGHLVCYIPNDLTDLRTFTKTEVLMGKFLSKTLMKVLQIKT